MARLPTPGADDGTWGGVLNDFLSVEHNTDGTLKSSGSLAHKADTADSRLTNQRVPTDGSVTNAKVAAAANIAQSKIQNLVSDLAAKTDTSKTRQIAVSIGDYATAGQLQGTEDATSAFQAAINSLGGKGGRVIAPAGAQFWFSGSSYVAIDNGRGNDVTVDFAGSTAFKTSTNGYYTIFNSRTGLGYGGGVKNFRIENGYFRGSFSDSSPANVNVFAANHGQHIVIRNCVFEQVQLEAGHTFELDGCDDVLIENCTWYGFKPASGVVPRTEAVNLDDSYNGAGASIPPYCDGLPCRNITMRDCKFFPLTIGNTTYPAPIPFGIHSTHEGAIQENITLDNIYVVDPPKDPATTSIGVDNPYIRGLVHVLSVHGLKVKMTVTATDNAGCIRLVQVQSSSVGGIGAPNDATGTSGTFDTPNVTSDIDIDITANGFLGTDSTASPLVFISGVSAANGNARNIHIRADIDGSSREAILLYHCENVDVQVTNCSNALRGVRTLSCERVRVQGNFYNCVYVVSNTDTNRLSVGPVTAVSDTTQQSVVAITSTDYVTATGISASGYNALYNSTPTHHAEAGNIVTA